MIEYRDLEYWKREIKKHHDNIDISQDELKIILGEDCVDVVFTLENKK